MRARPRREARRRHQPPAHERLDRSLRDRRPDGSRDRKGAARRRQRGRRAGARDARHPPAPAAEASRRATSPVRPVGGRREQDLRPSPLPRARIRSGARSASSTGDPGPVPAEEPRPREIVGVVADVTYPSFVDRAPAAVYIPFRQHVWQYAREDARIHTRKVLAVRTSVDPLSLVPAVEGRGGPGGPGPDRARLQDHGRPRPTSRLRDQQPLLRLALHDLRLAGDPARPGRRLRRDVVGRRPADERVRRAHGPRRASRRHRRDAARRVAPAHRCWASAWAPSAGSASAAPSTPSSSA